MTQLLLIRHAPAGHRASWAGDDRHRPLDDEGHAQTAALVPSLERFPIERVLTSPYLRCVQTVERLAAARRVPVEYRDELADDADPAEAGRLIRELAADGRPAVLCAHGDLIQELLAEELAKGAVAVLEVTPNAGLTRLETLAPPAGG